jgi:drug/metabolite transporter (DMT)-like permease
MPLAPHPVFSNRKFVFLLATLCCLLWGSSYPAIKNGYALFAIEPSDIASKMVFAGYRFALAGTVLLLMAVFGKRAMPKPGWTELREIATLGLTQTTAQYIFFYIGLAYTTGVKGSIMNSTTIFFSVLLAHFIYQNDRLSFNKIFGCLIGLAGVMVVNFNRELLDFNFTLLGEGFVVIAAFILAAATIYGKKISQKMDSLVLTGYQLVIGGTVLVIGGYAAGGTLSGFTFKSSMLLGYLILMSSASVGLWAILLKYNRVGMVSVFNFLVPIFGAILSAVFLGERILEWKNVIALALVCSGIWLVTKERA